MSLRDPWLPFGPPGPEAEVTLFCFHFAGGSAVFFRSWRETLEPGIAVCPVELPGRGSRFCEPRVGDLDAMVADLAPAIHRHSGKPFAFFGHSLGALVAFETARFLRRTFDVLPQALLVSARPAPQERSCGKRRYAMADAELVEELRSFNGTDSEILDNAELISMLLPVLRADFGLNECYGYRPEPPLPIPIHAFVGTEDPEISCEAMERWSAQTSAHFSMTTFPGDHFYLCPRQSELLDRLRGLVT